MDFYSRVTSRFPRHKFQLCLLCQREFRGRRHRHLKSWSEVVHSFIVPESGLTLVSQATAYICILYVCIKNHCYALTTVLRNRQNRPEARRSSKELWLQGDAHNSLECSISTFVCVILINFHVFMLPQSSWTSLSYKLNTTGQQKSCSFCWICLES